MEFDQFSSWENISDEEKTAIEKVFEQKVNVCKFR